MEKLSCAPCELKRTRSRVALGKIERPLAQPCRASRELGASRKGWAPHKSSSKPEEIRADPTGPERAPEGGGASARWSLTRLLPRPTHADESAPAASRWSSKLGRLGGLRAKGDEAGHPRVRALSEWREESDLSQIPLTFVPAEGAPLHIHGFCP